MPTDEETKRTLIYKLIQNNQELYNRFLDNRFCKGMAQGILPLSVYQDFAKASNSAPAPKPNQTCESSPKGAIL